MFTVKWIVRTPHGEVIRMFEAKEVCAAFRDPATLRSDPKAPKSIEPESRRWEVSGRSVDSQLFIMDPYTPNFGGRSLDCGTVYVMNEAGATVGKYVLNDEVVEHASPLHIPAEVPAGL